MTQLNPQQQAAVHYQEGPLLVLAGAGSGKTRVITEKICYLTKRRGLAPEKIAAITFTNKAAREMRARVSRRLGKEQARRLTISTFHALGWKILLGHAKQAGFRPGISILDEQDSSKLVADLLPANSPSDVLQLTRNQISRWKNTAMVASDINAAAEHAGEARFASIYAQYQEQLQTLNAVDFDDLILRPLILMQEPEIQQLWQEKLRYLLVDEYQDTNEAQYRLLKCLAGARGALTAVGDDDQSIYGWRGAQPENITQLGQDYPRLKVIKLEQNYRSCANILNAANAVIANNPHTFEKKLWSGLPQGEKIRILPCADAQQEAHQVVSEILHRKFTEKARDGQFAILYRGNHQSRVFEQALREHRLPYHLSGGTSFFERTEIKDLMAYLRLLVNPDDNRAFLRVVNTPRRDIGAKSLATIGTAAAAQKLSLFEASVQGDTQNQLPKRGQDSLRRFCQLIIEISDRGERGDPIAAVEDLLESIGYHRWLFDQADNPQQAERRIENAKELVSWIKRLAADASQTTTLTDLVGRLALLTSLDNDDDPGQAVRLMTLHSAKGLEFPYVFMVGVEEGTLPHRASLEEGNDQEERRLMYVGITRAELSLTLSFARRRQRFGETLRCEPSRFLAELPRELIQWVGEDPVDDPEDSKTRARAHLDNLRELLG